MKNVFAMTLLSLSVFAGAATTVIVPAAVAEEIQQAHQTKGVVKKIDRENNRVTLTHDAVPSLDWPSMTMGFAVKDPTLLKDVAPGEQVEIDFVRRDDGKFVITRINKL